MSGIGTSAFDEERLQSEMERYHNQLDSETERLYTLASEAREKGLDFSTEVEIPRAIDLADRTEKLLEEYLDGLEIAESIRTMLQEEDRETTAIKIACQVSNQMMERTGDHVSRKLAIVKMRHTDHVLGYHQWVWNPSEQKFSIS